MEDLSTYFKIDQLNIILAFTGIVVTSLTLMTAGAHIKKRLKEYYLLNIIFVIAFSALILSKDWLVFLVSWEIISISTALMLLWRNRGLAGQYLIVQFLGTSILMFVILLAIKNGYSEIMPIKEFWLQNLFIFGLGMKSSVFGFHFWLPPVHSQAPAPVSGILSGWVVKLGFIMYLKLIPDGNIILLILGLLMIFYGGIKALLASDYKVLLAYSSISQLGFIAIGIGSGTVLGYLGSILHIMAHSLAKSSLFAGSAYLMDFHKTRNIYDFNRSRQRPKLINMSLLFGFASLAGAPLLAGFNSKYLIKSCFYSEQIFNIKQTMPVWIVSIKLKAPALIKLFNGDLLSFFLYAASLLTGLYSIRFLYWGLFKGFKNNKDSLKAKGKEMNMAEYEDYEIGKMASVVMSLVMVFLVLLAFYNIPLLNIIENIRIEYDLLHGIIDFTVISILALIILRLFKWFKIRNNTLPSLDSLFNIVNKGLYKTSRILYIIIYHDFQYQLLWIPLFIVILFIFIYI